MAPARPREGTEWTPHMAGPAQDSLNGLPIPSRRVQDVHRVCLLAHSTQHTSTEHSSQHAANSHSAKRTAHSTQRTEHSSQHAANSTQRKAHSTQRKAHSAQRIAHNRALSTQLASSLQVGGSGS
eukprot:364730-Chlamydomonas_euryale.AAC.14